MGIRLDRLGQYAQERHGTPEGWRWVQADASPDAAPDGVIRIEGAVYPKGKWSKRDKDTERVLWVNEADFHAWEREKADAAGTCHACWGEREEFASWSKAEGTKMRPCSVCRGTGKPAAAAEEVPS
jgi:hypothetical protein